MPLAGEQPLDMDALPAAEYLMLEALAARYRTGEIAWTFPARLKKQAAALETYGLVSWKAGIAPKTILVTLTQAGKDAVLSATYVPPVSRPDIDPEPAKSGDSWGVGPQVTSEPPLPPDVTVMLKEAASWLKANGPTAAEQVYNVSKVIPRGTPMEVVTLVGDGARIFNGVSSFLNDQKRDQ